MFEIALGLQIREQKPFQVLAQNMNGGMEFLFFAIKSQLTYADPVRLSRLESGFELRFPISFSDTLNNILCWWNSLLWSEFFTGMFIYIKLNNRNFHCLSFFLWSLLFVVLPDYYWTVLLYWGRAPDVDIPSSDDLVTSHGPGICEKRFLNLCFILLIFVLKLSMLLINLFYDKCWKQ